MITAHLMDPIPQPSASAPGIPRAFDPVIARGMAKKPKDRYASAGDLAAAAQEALAPDQDQAARHRAPQPGSHHARARHGGRTAGHPCGPVPVSLAIPPGQNFSAGRHRTPVQQKLGPLQPGP